MSVGRSVGVLVPSITFERIRLWTSNLVRLFIRERFGLFLSEIVLKKGGEMEGLIGKKLHFFVKDRAICRFWVFVVYKFRFYNSHDILTNIWGTGKKEWG